MTELRHMGPGIRASRRGQILATKEARLVPIRSYANKLQAAGRYVMAYALLAELPTVEPEDPKSRCVVVKAPLEAYVYKEEGYDTEFLPACLRIQGDAKGFGQGGEAFGQYNIQLAVLLGDDENNQPLTTHQIGVINHSIIPGAVTGTPRPWDDFVPADRNQGSYELHANEATDLLIEAVSMTSVDMQKWSDDYQRHIARLQNSQPVTI